MKTISVYRPWSHLIAWGEKEYETRHWSPRGMNKGDYLAIHATKKFNQDDIKICDEEPFAEVLEKHSITNPEQQLEGGVIVCICRLLAVYRTEDIRDTLTEQERAFGNYQNKRYAWKLQVVQAFDPPIPATGAQGLWDWEPPAEDEPETDDPPTIPEASNVSTGTAQPRAFLFPPVVVANFDTVRNLWDKQLQRFDYERLVYCGRKNSYYSLPESIWHNPFKNGDAIGKFRDYLCNKRHDLIARLHELRDKTLICWCHPKPCHCDVLADLITQQFKADIIGWLESRERINPANIQQCPHCNHDYTSLRLICSSAWRNGSSQKYEGDYIVGCMACGRRSVVTHQSKNKFYW